MPAYLTWFGLGMLGAVWHAGRSNGNPLPAVLRMLGRFPELSWLFGLQVFWLTTLIKTTTFVQTRSQLMWIFVGNGVSAALLLAPLVFGDQSRGWLRAGLSRFPMRWLGEISYGTYLWHTIWLAVVLEWVKDNSVPSEFWVRFAIVVVFTLATAQLSLTLLERPVMKLVQGRSTRPTPAGSVAPPG